MKIALVHDYLSQDGGAEHVLKSLHEIWPEAPIFVLFHDKKKINYINHKKIQESSLAKMPFVKNIFQWYLPLMPSFTEQHNLKDFDIVLSSTSAFAKGIITKPDTVHISYCHTPPRYLWADSSEYISDLNCNKLVKLFLQNTIHKLRLWDKISADRVDYFIANSNTTNHRIQKYYRRNSSIIYPPINTAKFNTRQVIGDFYISGGRLVPYKRFDILVSTFNRLGSPLKIFGTGPEFQKLQKKAKKNIEFLGQIDEKTKIKLLSEARAFIHPQTEDFGITAIESMASGCPVIAYSKGGATETIINGVTGVFFHKQNWESLLNTLLKFNYKNWDSLIIQEHAKKFDTAIFKEKIINLVNSKFEEYAKKQIEKISF